MSLMLKNVASFERRGKVGGRGVKTVTVTDWLGNNTPHALSVQEGSEHITITVRESTASSHHMLKKRQNKIPSSRKKCVQTDYYIP